MTNWLAVSMGKDGVTKQTCSAPQKDMSMLTVFLSYRPMMAYTPLENWEQTARDKRENREGTWRRLVSEVIAGFWNVCLTEISKHLFIGLYIVLKIYFRYRKCITSTHLLFVLGLK